MPFIMPEKGRSAITYSVSNNGSDSIAKLKFFFPSPGTLKRQFHSPDFYDVFVAPLNIESFV